jgi:hypothetical protein
MARLTFLFYLIIISSVSKAQDSKDFIGKWKIIALNNGVYFNYKIDSSFVTNKFSNSLTGQKDSAESVAMFTSFASQYVDYYFIFDNQGNYQEIRQGDVRTSGTYKVDKDLNKIDITIKRNDKQNLVSYTFNFTKEGLKLFISSGFSTEILELTMEKSQ